MRWYCTGLVPAPQPPELRLGTYLKAAALPPIPDTFGHYTLIQPGAWNMYGNDQYGCCAWAGIAHVEMLWNATSKTPIHITTLDVLDDYRDATGFDIRKKSTDRGTDIVSAAKYWQQTGVRDCTDARHKIDAYLGIDPNNIDHIMAGCYLFGAVGLGIQLTDDAEEQFVNKQPWDAGKPSDMFHFVPFVGCDEEYLYCVTWGRLQRVTMDGFEQMVKEAVVYLSKEDLTGGKTAEGFDYAALESDLSALEG
jgi:hypothetical protein